jgi:hypothetical protein
VILKKYEKKNAEIKNILLLKKEDVEAIEKRKRFQVV